MFSISSLWDASTEMPLFGLRTGTVVLRIAFKRLKTCRINKMPVRGHVLTGRVLPDAPGGWGTECISVLDLNCFTGFYYCIAEIHCRQSYNIRDDHL